jgi:hypothetical protein
MNRTLKYALSAALSALIIVPAMAQDNFPDVPETHWAYRDLAKMKQEGLLVGYPDGLFRGGRPASRYELAVACHAVWANLKAITDGLKSQIDDLNAKMANAATKADVDDLRSKIAALEAEMNRIKNEDIASLRKMADEFRAELTKLGADVEAMKKDLEDMKGKVGWLWQHRLPFDVSGDANMWMGSGYSRAQAGGGFGVTVDGRPTGVARDGSGGLAGGTEDLTILHENSLKLVSNNESGPTLKAVMVFGNMFGNSQSRTAESFPGIAFGNQSGLFPGQPFEEAGANWYMQEFSVNFDTSILGLGFNADLGRTGYKVSPYIFQRPDTTPYFSNERWDDGRWMFDGGVLGFKFGGAKVDVFGGRNSGRFDTAFSEIQPMFAGGAGNPFSPGQTDRPRGFMRNNDFGGGGTVPGLSIDQSLGLNLSVPLSNTGALNLAYMWLDANQPLAVIGSSGLANRVNVYGGDLKFNFSNIDVEAGFSKSDVMDGTDAIINRNNSAWYATLGYAGSNFGIKGGYRRIDPQFAAPGDWGRIGIWWNPTDIKGFFADAHFDLNKNLRLMANAGFYTGTNTTINGVTGLGDDDHLNHGSIGIGYKMGTNHSLLLGIETVQWDLEDRAGVGFIGGKPTETWFNIGWGVDLSARAKFNVLWQISKYDSKGVAGMGPFGFGPGGAAQQTKAEGGLITTQLSFRF